MDLLEPSKNAVICAFNKLVELDEQGVKNYVFSDEVPKEAKADAAPAAAPKEEAKADAAPAEEKKS